MIPSTAGTILKEVPSGGKVQLLEKRGELWMHVVFEGKHGYVLAHHLKLEPMKEKTKG